MTHFHDEADAGESNSARINIAAKPYDRTLRIRIKYYAQYETPGDPWFLARLFIDDEQAWQEKRDTIPGPPNLIDHTFNKHLPASTPMRLRADVDNFHSKNVSLVMTVDA